MTLLNIVYETVKRFGCLIIFVFINIQLKQQQIFLETSSKIMKLWSNICKDVKFINIQNL